MLSPAIPEGFCNFGPLFPEAKEEGDDILLFLASPFTAELI